MSTNVRCPACSRILKPPANAPRFRCICGQILARPRQQQQVNNFQQRTQQPIPNHVQRYQPPPQPQPQVRPQQNVTPPSRVRCPTCQTILLPPAGASLFRCSSCSTTLRAPEPVSTTQAASSAIQNNFRQMQTTMSRTNETARPAPSRAATNMLNLVSSTIRNMGYRQGDNNNAAVNEGPRVNVVPPEPTPVMGGAGHLDEDLTPDQVVEQFAGSNQEYWLRNLGAGEKICWVRLMSTEQEEKIAKLLNTWETDMKNNLENLEEYDLKTRIEMLEVFPSVDLTNMEEMAETLTNAKVFLKESKSMEEVTAILNNLQVDHTTCINLDQLVERLMAAVWYGPTRLCDGFVREFKGKLELNMIPAQQYGLDLDYKKLKISYDELENMTQASFQKKVAWFKAQCDKHRVPWEEGRVEIKIDRNDILQDSFYKFRNLQAEDFRKNFKFEFAGEIGIDAGGLSREWFELVVDACFNVDCGLFEYSGVDNICYQFNPNSGVANELHLEYFRFIGRIVGKAVFDQKYIKAHLTQPIFKHILGYPITFDDIEYCDQKIYENLKQLEEIEDVSLLMLTFTCTISVFGEYLEIELKEGGAEIDVTNANVQEYILLMTKHYMFARTKGQLVHFLKGIYDVVPEIWLSVFDYREFELLLCGLPNINVADWKAHTLYRGEYAARKDRHKVIKWFWEYVESRDQEQKARLLQFCTGTSRVPVAGFAALQGRSGQVQHFTLEAVSTSKLIYPRAHTCFNRLDLPLYKTRKDLFRRLEEACSISMTGFNDE